MHPTAWERRLRKRSAYTKFARGLIVSNRTCLVSGIPYIPDSFEVLKSSRPPMLRPQPGSVVGAAAFALAAALLLIGNWNAVRTHFLFDIDCHTRANVLRGLTVLDPLSAWFAIFSRISRPRYCPGTKSTKTNHAGIVHLSTTPALCSLGCRRPIIRTVEASRSLICERIFECRRSDTTRVYRSLLKLAPNRSMNAQRYIWPRTSLSGRYLLPCKLIGRAVYLYSSPDRALVAGRWHALNVGQVCVIFKW